MAKGLKAFERRLNAIPNNIRRAAMKTMERYADRIVADMRNLVPVRYGALKESIGWTWGDIPPGALKIGTVRGNDYGKMSIRIYAGTSDKSLGKNDAFYALFVEFGTSPHSVARGARKKPGKEPGALIGGKMHPGARATPFFYPAWRANKRATQAAITRSIRKAIKES